MSLEMKKEQIEEIFSYYESQSDKGTQEMVDLAFERTARSRRLYYAGTKEKSHADNRNYRESSFCDFENVSDD